MKSENNNSFTIQTTNGGAQDYTIFAKEEEAQIPADQLVSGMSSVSYTHLTLPTN